MSCSSTGSIPSPSIQACARGGLATSGSTSPGTSTTSFPHPVAGDGLSFHAWKAAGERSHRWWPYSGTPSTMPPRLAAQLVTRSSLATRSKTAGTSSLRGVLPAEYWTGDASWPAISYRVKSNLIRFDPGGGA